MTDLATLIAAIEQRIARLRELRRGTASRSGKAWYGGRISELYRLIDTIGFDPLREGDIEALTPTPEDMNRMLNFDIINDTVVAPPKHNR